MSCEDCRKYTVSCGVLEGFECCKCCGIGECEYDICPKEEKLPISLTVHEFYYSSEVNGAFNSINNAKHAFFKGKFNMYRFNNAKHAKSKFKKLKTQLVEDTSIREHVKAQLIKDVNNGLSSCKDLENLILNKLGLSKKKGNFKYFKRNLDKFSDETIGKIRKLSHYERYKLLKLKGVDNPLILIR